MSPITREPLVAVVIPCYRVSRQVAGVLQAIGPEVWRIYCVDDGCPEQSRLVVEKAAAEDPRIRCLVHPRNMGVGAAVVTGYKQAFEDGADVIVKLDGDGQMDPARIPRTRGTDPPRRGRLRQRQPLLSTSKASIHAPAAVDRQCGAFVPGEDVDRLLGPVRSDQRLHGDPRRGGPANSPWTN